MEGTVVFALPALLPSLSSHDFIIYIYIYLQPILCQRDLKQLTKIEYGRIKTEKDKLGETRKYKAGGMREVGNVGELGKEKG